MFHLQSDGEAVDFSVWVGNKDSTISQVHAVNKVLEGERLIKHIGYWLLYSIAEADVGGVSMSNPSKI